MSKNNNKVFKLVGKVQHYAWGGLHFIPDLLGIPNSGNQPFAEYWLGAHDNASSELITEDGQKIKLNEYLEMHTAEALGTAAEKFGRLPYLLKILDVKDMLSIQVHPSKTNAEKEFSVEQKKGIPTDAPNRNYKDDNHKPELMLALSEFWLLHGFKSQELLNDTLRKIKELNPLVAIFEKGGYRELYKHVMTMEQSEVNSMLQPLIDRIIPAYREGRLQKDDENFWAARAALTYNSTNKIDRGIFSVYFFNLVQLHPGEAVFQDAGLPHAYLEGQNVEIMANSDNVLRGGLTTKHIDTNELLKHIQFEVTIPQVVTETITKKHIGAYLTPAPDFELGKIELGKGEFLGIVSKSAEIFLVLQGSVTVSENTDKHFLRKRGDAWIALDKAVLSLEAGDAVVIYRARVPDIEH